jgi:arginyl-tRNA--protein-N-Asp/Glu arginylyltransferase
VACEGEEATKRVRAYILLSTLSFLLVDMFNRCFDEFNKHHAFAEGEREHARKGVAGCILVACLPCVCIDGLCQEFWMNRRAKREANKKEVQNEVHQFAKSNPNIEDSGDLYRQYLAERHGIISPTPFSMCFKMIADSHDKSD